MSLSHPPRALLFDVFGTCVDWRSTVTNGLWEATRKSLNATTVSIPPAVALKASQMTKEEWGVFTQQWRNTYKAFTKTIASDSSKAWKTVDEHHYDSLKELLAEWQLGGLWTEEEVRDLSLIWHRLDGWPDSSTGIQELNKRFWTCTLSNGNLSLLNDLKVHAKMDFTHVFSAEQFGSYKPNPSVYLGAVEKLGLSPKDCAMVAAHLYDLKAARACGLQTVYVERPQEEDIGDEKIQAIKKEGWVDVWVTLEEDGFVTAAEKLGIQVVRPKV